MARPRSKTSSAKTIKHTNARKPSNGFRAFLCSSSGEIPTAGFVECIGGFVAVGPFIRVRSVPVFGEGIGVAKIKHDVVAGHTKEVHVAVFCHVLHRSEERRVGKGGRSR